MSIRYLLRLWWCHAMIEKSLDYFLVPIIHERSEIALALEDRSNIPRLWMAQRLLSRKWFWGWPNPALQDHFLAAFATPSRDGWKERCCILMSQWNCKTNCKRYEAGEAGSARAEGLLCEKVVNVIGLV